MNMIKKAKEALDDLNYVYSVRYELGYIKLYHREGITDRAINRMTDAGFILRSVIYSFEKERLCAKFITPSN